MIVKDAAGNKTCYTAVPVTTTAASDTTAPAIADKTITSSSVSQTGVTLSWNKATDETSAQAALQYLVYQSSSNNLGSVANIEANGTALGSYSADIAAKTVATLTAGTTYYFNVIVKDAAGNKTCYTAVPVTTTAVSSGGASSGASSSDADASTPVEVNGQSYSAGTSQTTTGSDGQTTTTVTVDTDKLNTVLNTQGTGATVTIPVTSGSDVASGALTGDMVKTMENKDATLKIQTDAAAYTLPASEINIDAVSSQLGTNVSLSDITVSVSISEPTNATAKVVADAAVEGGFTVQVPAVDFTITCAYNGKTVDVSSFNSYVERMIAIPAGVDPTKITTGVVVKPDGTTYHVPTQVVEIDGGYYAKINSLTNSTYTVIWHPVQFADAANHWAKAAINDLGSRMVVTGDENGNFNPDAAITRAEFAAIVVRALGLAPGTGESSFSDVNSSEWYCGYVETAAAYGLINGYSAAAFGPNDLITREQAMTIIARAMKITGLTIALTGSDVSALIGAYTDGASASDYAEDSIAVCLKAAIVTGTSDSTIAPKDNVTRAEVAVMIERLLLKSELI